MCYELHINCCLCTRSRMSHVSSRCLPPAALQALARCRSASVVEWRALLLPPVCDSRYRRRSPIAAVNRAAAVACRSSMSGGTGTEASSRGLGGRIGGGIALGQRQLASGHAGSAREVPRQALRDATAFLNSRNGCRASLSGPPSQQRPAAGRSRRSPSPCRAPGRSQRFAVPPRSLFGAESRRGL